MVIPNKVRYHDRHFWMCSEVMFILQPGRDLEGWMEARTVQGLYNVELGAQ